MNDDEPIAGDTELILEFEIPDDVDDQEAVDRIVDVVVALDDYHRSLGGNGLEVVRPEDAISSWVAES